MAKEKMIQIRKLDKNVSKSAKQVCEKMLKDLEKARRPVLSAIKCSLDNSAYDSKKGYLTPKGKMVKSELNVSSVQKISRSIFLLEILLNKSKDRIGEYQEGVVLYL